MGKENVQEQNINSNLERDLALESIQKNLDKIREDSIGVSIEIVSTIQELINNENSDITIKEVISALSNVILSISRDQCEGNDEDFNNKRKRAAYLLEAKVIPAIMPISLGGNSKDEDVVEEDKSILTLFILAGIILDYAVWSGEMSNYSQLKMLIDKKEKENNDDAECNLE